LFRQEVELAKTELSEKLQKIIRSSVGLAVGGLVAYTGLSVLLLGLGLLLAWLFAAAGLQPIVAVFVGVTAVGLLVGGVGSVMVLKAIKTLRKGEFTPQHTLHELKKLRGADFDAAPEPKPAPERKANSEELHARAEATEKQMADAIQELTYRFSPSEINQRVRNKIGDQPYSAGLMAAVAGLVSGIVVSRHGRHNGH
jgi:hypothetical protein